MAVTPFDSATFRTLFGDTEVAQLFTDSAEVRALLLVEGALAQAQGATGIIPSDSAAFIQRAVMEVQIDPSGLAAATGQNAVVIPALVHAFNNATDAPEHAQYFHFGATSQDIIDTALVLRLRQVITIYKTRLSAIIRALGTLAQTHATLPMAGRTYGQNASPVSFGAVVAAWGMPLVTHLQRLDELSPRLLRISLSGAAGTLSAIDGDHTALRKAFGAALNLGVAENSWHSTRDSIAELSAWITLVATSLGKTGEDLLTLTRSGINEVGIGAGGASSTMPQKSNPVLPSLTVALGRQTAILNTALQSATLHREQRDGAAWFMEWMSLGQICVMLARALSATQELANSITPDPEKMRENLDDGTGLIYAEALTFRLAKTTSRATLKDQVKTLCQKAKSSGTPLSDLAARHWPDADLTGVFSPDQQLGSAPDDARRFARIAKAY
jgi:3-carboxy-cis,cis-muconate cycloisomerase